jgi:acyl-coenzyme A thioesterase PaaI-like protein
LSPPRDLRSQFAPVSPPPPPRKASKRNFSNIVVATISIMVGLMAGQYMRLVLVPPPLPLPNTAADDDLTAYITNMANKLPLVQSLSSDPEWKSWDAYASIPASERPGRLTTGALGGSRGLGGFQRVFQHASSGEFISVLWIGGALAGFPGVAHGGLIATVLDESLGRCAIQKLERKTGVTANLEIKYLLPTVTNGFWVIRCLPVVEGSMNRKSFVKATLESLEGKVHVEAKGLFVVPKGIKLRELGDGF